MKLADIGRDACPQMCHESRCWEAISLSMSQILPKLDAESTPVFPQRITNIVPMTCAMIKIHLYGMKNASNHKIGVVIESQVSVHYMSLSSDGEYH